MRYNVIKDRWDGRRLEVHSNGRIDTYHWGSDYGESYSDEEFSWSDYWASLISATVGGDGADNIIALDFPTFVYTDEERFTVTVNGVAVGIDSSYWVVSGIGATFNLVLIDGVIYGDNVVVTFSESETAAIVDNEVAAEDEVLAYISGLVTPLSAEHVIDINNLIRGMKSGLGVDHMTDWADVFYHLAAETAEASLKNMVKDAHHAIAVNGPVHTPFEGWQGDGVSSYINTNYNPAADGVNFTQNNASQGVYIRNNEVCAAVLGCVSGSNKCHLTPRNGSNQFWAAINTANYANMGYSGSSIGFFISTRTASNLISGYKNKSLVSTSSDSSIPVVNLNHIGLGVHRGAGYYFYSNNQLSLIFEGKGLTQTNVNYLTDRFEALMDANGKGVIA